MRSTSAPSPFSYRIIFHTPIPDLSNSSLEEFQHPEFEGYGPKTSKSVSKDTSNEVRESPDALLVEELVSNDKLKKKTIFPTVAKINFVKTSSTQKTSLGNQLSTRNVQANCNYHQRDMMVSGNNLIQGGQIPDKSRKGLGFISYNVVSPLPTRLFSPPNLNLSYSGLEEFEQHEFKGYGPKTSKSVSEDTSNEVRESPDASLVEELVSNNKLEKKTVFLTVAKINFVRPQQQEKLVRKPVKYMTVNMSYLSNFKKFDGGYVAFAGGAKGGRITRSISACHSSEETGSSQDYILMPLWKDGSPFDSSSKDASNDEPQPSNDAGKKDDEGGIDDQERTKNSAQDVNTVGPSINTASTNFNTGSLNINTVSPTVPTAPLESTYADFFGDESELDLSNIATTYPVPTTPNTRIHKDHSLDHVLGDVQSGVQTRRMINEQGFISVVYEGKTHEDLHTCLFACFLSQEEPKKVIQALKDPSWIEAMQEELLQFKLQQVWTLVDLPYGKRAIGTK
ncbi:hypothetical protein Tco_0814524 [Tanacetum coccineum]